MDGDHVPHDDANDTASGAAYSDERSEAPPDAPLPTRLAISRWRSRSSRASCHRSAAENYLDLRLKVLPAVEIERPGFNSQVHAGPGSPSLWAAEAVKHRRGADRWRSRHRHFFVKGVAFAATASARTLASRRFRRSA